MKYYNFTLRGELKFDSLFRAYRIANDFSLCGIGFEEGGVIKGYLGGEENSIKGFGIECEKLLGLKVETSEIKGEVPIPPKFVIPEDYVKGLRKILGIK